MKRGQELRTRDVSVLDEDGNEAHDVEMVAVLNSVERMKRIRREERGLEMDLK